VIGDDACLIDGCERQPHGIPTAAGRRQWQAAQGQRLLARLPKPADRGEAVVRFPHRRRFLELAAGAAALPATPHVAKAQAYPVKSTRFIIGFAPGGTAGIRHKKARRSGAVTPKDVGQAVRRRGINRGTSPIVPAKEKAIW
jgi:hypothetical protein